MKNFEHTEYALFNGEVYSRNVYSNLETMRFESGEWENTSLEAEGLSVSDFTVDDDYYTLVECLEEAREVYNLPV